MTQHDDKENQVRRYLRSAARFERRKENDARRKKSGRRPRRARSDDGFEEGDPDWGAARRRGRPREELPSAAPRAADAVRAVVVSVARGAVHLRVGDTTHFTPLGRAPLSGPLAVGDELEVAPRDGGPPRILGHVPRRSALTRVDPGNRHRVLTLAANIDVGVVVCAAAAPPLRPALIDRYLIALERGGVGALVCVNKIDLADDAAARARLDAQLRPYRELGVPVVLASAAAAQGLADLRAAPAGRTAVLVGHSGVGKSSLLNALAGASLSAEGRVRAFDGKGRHTTTSSCLHELPGGARLIDTPGVRAFGLTGVDRETLRTGFPGFGGLPTRCRFGDCSHRVEPDCAVRAAAHEGQLNAARYEVYLRLLQELEA